MKKPEILSDEKLRNCQNFGQVDDNTRRVAQAQLDDCWVKILGQFLEYLVDEYDLADDKREAFEMIMATLQAQLEEAKE